MNRAVVPRCTRTMRHGLDRNLPHDALNDLHEEIDHIGRVLDDDSKRVDRGKLGNSGKDWTFGHREPC